MTSRRSLRARIDRLGVRGLGAAPTQKAKTSAFLGTTAAETPEVVSEGTRLALASLSGQKTSKYGNQPTTVDGKRFASKREAERYCELAAAERGGVIWNLRTHTRWPLVVNGVKIADYEDDFNYAPIIDTPEPGMLLLGDLVVEDAKGVRTAVYKLKAKLLHACYGITIVEV